MRGLEAGFAPAPQAAEVRLPGTGRGSGPALPSPRPEALPSPSGQTGQHSPGGATAPGQFLVSSQITSSHSTLPLSQTQIRQTSGFHTSRSWYLMPFCTQVTGGTEARGEERGCLRRPSLPPQGSGDPNPTARADPQS